MSEMSDPKRSHARAASRLLLAGLVTAIGALSPHAVAAQSETADYEVIFDATWSAQTHPNEFPPGAHFSNLVGGTHDSNAVFWAPGELASFGIERMAEAGSTGNLLLEIDAEITAGSADQGFTGSGGINSPGQTTLSFTANLDHPELTLVTMVAPSPDWFLGVHGLSLLDGGWWIPEQVVDLFAYDAGTDDGTTFIATDADSDPPQPISLLGPPIEPGVPLGQFTIRRLPEPAFGLGLSLATVGLAAASRRRTPDAGVRHSADR